MENMSLGGLNVMENVERELVSLLPCSEDGFSPGIRELWKELIRASTNLDVLYQSPAWFDHLTALYSDKKPGLGLACTTTGRVLGLAPMARGRYPLQFEIKGRVFWNSYLDAVFILGGEPIFPPHRGLYDALFAQIKEIFAVNSNICFYSIRKGSYCWRYLQESAQIKENFFLYMPGGTRPYHAIEMPLTFEEYLEKFSSKKRYNLQRQLKLLEKNFGPLQLRTIQAREQISQFLEAARHITHQSWQFTRLGIPFNFSFQALADLADRHLLRSYLLMAGDKICAYALGNQFQDRYYYEKIGYDPIFARFSPGTGLLYLIIKDLIESTSVRRFSFGFGDASYKREFGNIHGEEATILLMKKTFSNQLKRIVHEAFFSLIRNLKGWLRLTPKPAQPVR